MTNPKVKIRRKNIEKILLAAEKVFAEQGYAGTKMADIAQQAQLPRSNLHYYFSTKDELYREVLVNLLDTWNWKARVSRISTTRGWCSPATSWKR